METTAERIALSEDVDLKRVDRLIQLVDLSDLDDGKPDRKAIAKVVKKTLDECSEFKKPAGNGAAPGAIRTATAAEAEPRP